MRAGTLGLVVDDKEAVRAALADAGVAVASSGGLRFDDPWGNSIEIVDYRDVQFTKAPAILSVLAPEGLANTEAARAELARKASRVIDEEEHPGDPEACSLKASSSAVHADRSFISMLAGGKRQSIGQSNAVAQLSGHAHALLADGHDISGSQLAPSARVDLAVDGHCAVLHERARLAARIGQARELQQLAETDRLLADRNLARVRRAVHRPIIAAGGAALQRS